jgi:hypothetical protein
MCNKYPEVGVAPVQKPIPLPMKTYMKKYMLLTTVWVLKMTEQVISVFLVKYPISTK